jgi:hypothetical protein
MRLVRLVPAVLMLILFVSVPSFAQEWLEYYSKTDFFLVNFPGAPKVQDITYPTEFGLTLPGHVHLYEDGPTRYSVTVIDYGNVQQIHAKRLEGCKAYPNLCTNPWVGEVRGALDFAAWHFMQRDARVTYYAYANSDRIEGRRVQLANPDKSRTYGAIYMHENRLYILDATTPAGAPPPALFQQSMGFLDKDGKRVRYATIYANGYPVPAREPGEGRFAGCE